MPISSQLRSHRLFSENWERLAYLVDAATLYHTGLSLLVSWTSHSGHAHIDGVLRLYLPLPDAQMKALIQRTKNCYL